MKWPWQSQPPLTAAELAVEEVLASIMRLPVGSTITLPERAQDGFGGLIIVRHSAHTLVFQRSGYNGRSRWADNAEQARGEIGQYFATGKLSEPENIRGW